MIEKRPIEGLLGQPYLPLEDLIDTSAFEMIDQEICIELAKSGRNDMMSGGSFRSLRIIPMFEREKNLIDVVDAVTTMTKNELYLFFSLNPDQRNINDRLKALREDPLETELNLAQTRYLKIKHGVYFSWTTVLLLNLPKTSLNWEDLAHSNTRSLCDEMSQSFPVLSDFILKLPFESIGRVVLLGNDAFQFGMTHWDRRPDIYPEPCEFINFSPSKKKKMFLWDEENQSKTYVESSIHWFNDADYHGVEEQPFFQYAIRVDGKFNDAFKKVLKEKFPPK